MDTALQNIQNRAARIKESIIQPSFRCPEETNELQTIVMMPAIETTGSSDVLVDELQEPVFSDELLVEEEVVDNEEEEDGEEEEDEEEEEAEVINTGNLKPKAVPDLKKPPPAAAPQALDGNRLKNARRSLEDSLVCPITLELPFFPVTAEDGRIYERSEIEKYFQAQAGSNDGIRSPVNNEPMGKRLLPAPQIKSHIELLLDMDLIAPDLAAKWRERAQQEKDKKSLLEQAEEGNVEAMEKVAYNYRNSNLGFRKDNKKAYEWYGKAHKAGSTLATARFGEYLVKGIGVKRNVPKGFIYLTMVANKGSDIAAYILGMCFCEGLYGVQVDKEEAMYWLEKVTDEANNLHHDHGDHSNRRFRAQEKLDEMNQEESAEHHTSDD